MLAFYELARSSAAAYHFHFCFHSSFNGRILAPLKGVRKRLKNNDPKYLNTLTFVRLACLGLANEK